MTTESVSRRDFLRIAGVSAGVALSAACAGATPPPGAGPTAAGAAESTTTSSTAAPQQPATTPSRYQEAPMLSEMVAAGTLPPVEERLPLDPLVIEPLEEIGQYGGMWRLAEANTGLISSRYGAEPLVTWGRDARSIVPNLAHSWDIEDEGRVYTYYLRQGVKWSDGEPFTTDDIMFWYEDVLLNEELTPTFPKWLAPGGSRVVIEKVDDYTVRFRFQDPAGLFPDYLAFSGNSIVNYPKHYLQQFHPKYADPDELAALVKDRGFEFWYQLFAAEVNPAINPDLPTLRPWKIVTKPITTTATAQRNPYYWKVDPEGRQLPYVDEIFWNIIQSVEMIPVRILSGKVDMQAQYVSFGDYSLLMEGREKGEYRVNIWDYGESGSAMHVNQSRQGDDEMAELLRNRDFRIALSKAIRRDEVNELFYAGLAASNLELYPESVKSDPEIQALFEYDLDEANALLDGLGLDKRNDDGIRLLPSGRPLRFVHMTSNNYAIHIDTGQILVNFLRELGIDAVTEIEPGETWWDRMPRNDWDSIGYVVDYTNGNLYWLNYPRSYFPVETSTYWATGWGYYYQTDGREGTEPVGEDARRLVDIWNEINVTIDMDRRKELMDEVFYICAYNLWPITVVGGGLVPCVVKNDFRNVPESATLAWPIYSPRPWNPEHFFHKQA